MSALELLLGPPSARAAEVGVRTLQAHGGIHVHLQEDDTCENVILFSVAERFGPSRQWREEYPHPDHPEASAEMRLDPHDGKVYLVEIWPRHLMDKVSLPAAVQRHAERCAQARYWLQALREELEEEGDEP
jgi:hypothetical protein